MPATPKCYARSCKLQTDAQCITKNASFGGDTEGRITVHLPGEYVMTGGGLQMEPGSPQETAVLTANMPDQQNGWHCDAGAGTGAGVCYVRGCKMAEHTLVCSNAEADGSTVMCPHNSTATACGASAGTGAVRAFFPSGNICHCSIDDSNGGTCHARCCRLGTKVACVVGEWTSWGTCTSTCGIGIQTRTRQVNTHSAHGGAACPSLAEQRECQTNPCPVDCAQSQWAPWSQCSVPCGQSGKRTRTRTVEVQPKYGGTACGDATEDDTCEQQNPCPVPCQVSGWGEFGQCSHECNGGTMTRTRTISQHPEHNAPACPHTSEDRPCNLVSCSCEEKCKRSPGCHSYSEVAHAYMYHTYCVDICPTLVL